jgi:ABC-type microcin C transport system permease subunit YejE
VIWCLLGVFGVWINLVMSLSVRFREVFMVIWLMRTVRVTWVISVIQVFKYMGFDSVIKEKRVIITLNEYVKASRSVRHQVSGKDG